MILAKRTRAAGDPLRAQTIAAPQASPPLWGRVPKPFAAQQAGGPGQTADVPALKRNEFPLQVSMENPLRFSGARPGGEAAAAAVGFARERAGSPPLVARRVPGVGAMPYERFGFALLPGWNGAEEPTWPSAGARPPAAGTLWAQEAEGGRAAGPRLGGARPLEAESGSTSATPLLGPQRGGPQAGLVQP